MTSLSTEESKATTTTPTTPSPPRIPVGILGGTGLVGRMLARSLTQHPFLSCGPVVGSLRSAGQLFENVWNDKESALEKHYGKELWTGDRDFPPELLGSKVVDVDGLLQIKNCRVVISAVAPRLGFLEDKLTAGTYTFKNVTLVFISFFLC